MDRKDFNDWIQEFKKLFPKKVKHHFLKNTIEKLDGKMGNEIIYQNLTFVEDYIKCSNSILDFGFGKCDKTFFIRKLNKKARITGLETLIHDDIDDNCENTRDFNQELKSFISTISKKYKIQFDYYDGKNIPYDDKKFDLVFSYGVLEHISPKHRSYILAELSRILKRGGYLLILRLPRSLSITEFISRRLGTGFHKWLLTREYIDNLIAHKFKIVKIRKIDSTFCFPVKITNKFYPILKPLDNFFSWTQLNFWAHDYSIILMKI